MDLRVGDTIVGYNRKVTALGEWHGRVGDVGGVWVALDDSFGLLYSGRPLHLAANWEIDIVDRPLAVGDRVRDVNTADDYAQDMEVVWVGTARDKPTVLVRDGDDDVTLYYDDEVRHLLVPA